MAMFSRLEGRLDTSKGMVHFSLLPHGVSNMTAILFQGDDCSRIHDPYVQKFSNSETISRILGVKLCDSNIWIIHPRGYKGPFAIYQGYLPQIKNSGDPLDYCPKGFPALKSTLSTLQEASQALLPSWSSFSQSREGRPIKGEPFMQNVPIVLLGFSKGGVVLNQILSEIVYSKSQSSNCCVQHTPTSSYPQAGKPALVDSSAVLSLIENIRDVHYVDVGSNSAGAHLTDQTQIRELVIGAQSQKYGLNVFLHGTPRQWNDSNRPWIRQEKDRFVSALRVASSEQDDSSNFSVHEMMYFGNKPGSLRMHFQILEAMELRMPCK